MWCRRRRIRALVGEIGAVRHARRSESVGYPASMYSRVLLHAHVSILLWTDVISYHLCILPIIVPLITVGECGANQGGVVSTFFSVVVPLVQSKFFARGSTESCHGERTRRRRSR